MNHVYSLHDYHGVLIDCNKYTEQLFELGNTVKLQMMFIVSTVSHQTKKIMPKSLIPDDESPPIHIFKEDSGSEWKMEITDNELILTLKTKKDF